MIKTITTVLGALLCLTALIGFVDNDFMRMALNPLHDSFLLLMGAISLYFGIRGTEFQARNMCRVLGVMFGLLGLMTLLAPPGVAVPGEVSIQSDHVLKLIPDALEYTTADGVRDLLTGIVGLIAGFFPREKEIEIDMAADRAREKVSAGR
jgi:hypothetical protein